MNAPQPLDLRTYDFLRNRGQRVAMIARIYGYRTVDAMVDHLVSLAARPMVDVVDVEPEPEPEPGPAVAEKSAATTAPASYEVEDAAPAPARLQAFSADAVILGELAGLTFNALQAPPIDDQTADSGNSGHGGPAAAEPRSQRKKAKRRFTEHAKLNPDRAAAALAPDHPALNEARTLFPSTVVAPTDSPRLLISGHNSRKIGDRVVRGPWAGLPIFTLTLEERATCPTSCSLLDACYGNAMHLARRHRHGPELIARLEQELRDLSDAHPVGYVIRLHVLGDFWSVEYVEFWRDALSRHRGLHVFGYTAWERGTPIGDAVHRTAAEQWDRFAVRQSVAPDAQLCAAQATTIWYVPEGQRIAEGYVCPAQTGRVDCCGDCGICWAPGARFTRIVFVGHGMARRGGGWKRTDTTITMELLERLLVRDRLTYAEAAQFLDSTPGIVARLSRRFGIKLKPGRKPRPEPATTHPARPSDEAASAVPVSEPAAAEADLVAQDPQPEARPVASVWDKPISKSQRIRELLAEGRSRKETARLVGVAPSFVSAIVCQDRERAQRNAGAAEQEPHHEEAAADRPVETQAAEPAVEQAPERRVLEQPTAVPAAAEGDGEVRLPPRPPACPDRSGAAAGAPVGRGGERGVETGPAARPVTKPAVPVGDLIAPSGSPRSKQPRSVHPVPQALPPSIVEPSARRSDADRAAAEFAITPSHPAKKSGGRLQLADLTASMCHWPHNDPKAADFHFCGKTALPGRPYCAEHEARAYVSGDARRTAEKGAEWSAARIVGRSPR